MRGARRTRAKTSVEYRGAAARPAGRPDDVVVLPTSGELGGLITTIPRLAVNEYPAHAASEITKP
jgi:hypothetical protein